MPNCPQCGSEMVKRKARRGPHAGNEFYGCPNWKTTCKGVIVNIGDDEEGKTDIIQPVEKPQVLDSKSKLVSTYYC